MSIEQLKSNIESIRVARKAYEEAIQRGEAEELEIKKQLADLEKKASMPREWEARIGHDGALYPEWLCAPHGSSALITVREVKPMVLDKEKLSNFNAILNEDIGTPFRWTHSYSALRRAIKSLGIEAEEPSND